MTNRNLIGSVVVSALAIAWSAGGALAGSAATDAYLANMRENMDTLTQSSAAAVDKTSSDAIKAYAAHEFGVGDTQSVASAEATDVPTVVAANMTDPAMSPDGLQTGRSADTGRTVDPTIYAAPLGAGVVMPTAPLSMSYLGTTDGKGFDWTYKAVQENALTSLVGLTKAYSMTGDDPGLRATAIGQLPKIEARLAELRAL